MSCLKLDEIALVCENTWSCVSCVKLRTLLQISLWLSYQSTKLLLGWVEIKSRCSLQETKTRVFADHIWLINGLFTLAHFVCNVSRVSKNAKWYSFLIEWNLIWNDDIVDRNSCEEPERNRWEEKHEQFWVKDILQELLVIIDNTMQIKLTWKQCRMEWRSSAEVNKSDFCFNPINELRSVLGLLLWVYAGVCLLTRSRETKLM